jgi:hypothetical protein
MSKEEIEVILKALLIGKASGLDDILNEVLKTLAPEILKGLTHAISKLLIGDTILVRFQELTTLVLHKEDKKDYSLLDNYHLIALKNILAKVIKKVLMNHLSLVVKEHNLLP